MIFVIGDTPSLNSPALLLLYSLLVLPPSICHISNNAHKTVFEAVARQTTKGKQASFKIVLIFKPN